MIDDWVEQLVTMKVVEWASMTGGLYIPEVRWLNGPIRLVDCIYLKWDGCMGQYDWWTVYTWSEVSAWANMTSGLYIPEVWWVHGPIWLVDCICLKCGEYMGQYDWWTVYTWSVVSTWASMTGGLYIPEVRWVYGPVWLVDCIYLKCGGAIVCIANHHGGAITEDALIWSSPCHRRSGTPTHLTCKHHCVTCFYHCIHQGALECGRQLIQKVWYHYLQTIKSWFI